jgi:hypothetical protein
MGLVVNISGKLIAININIETHYEESGSSGHAGRVPATAGKLLAGKKKRRRVINGNQFSCRETGTQ